MFKKGNDEYMNREIMKLLGTSVLIPYILLSGCTKEPIEMDVLSSDSVLDNDFHNIRFSFDLNGYPNEVTVDVFTSEKNFKEGKVAYSFDYVTDFNTENIDIQNNIKDNPDEFEIQYKE